MLSSATSVAYLVTRTAHTPREVLRLRRHSAGLRYLPSSLIRIAGAAVS